MGPETLHAYQQFQSTELPLKNLIQRNKPKGVQNALEDALPVVKTKTQQGSEKGWDGQIHIETFSLGPMPLICAKTTPMVAVKEVTDLKTVVIQYEGKTNYKEQGLQTSAPRGCVLVHNNHDGIISCEGGCAITFEIEPSRLKRTCRAMGGKYERAISNLQMECIGKDEVKGSEKWFGLFGYVDLLLGESQAFPSAMGIDEQIYRLMSLHYLRKDGEWRDSEWTNKHVTPSGQTLRNLERYIDENCAKGLTLTDLELQSSYSGRQLQNIFMATHGCTPMQYVRRTRLTIALERIENARPGDSVALIAREMGYRQTSHFSADFKKYFGHPPSDVIRASMRKGMEA